MFAKLFKPERSLPDCWWGPVSEWPGLRELVLEPSEDAWQTLFLNGGRHGCWVVCLLNLKLWSISLFASKPKSKSLKLCPWNTKQKTAPPDPPEAKWLVKAAQWAAVRHVAGSVAHEAPWPNPVSPHVPCIHTQPSLCSVMFAAPASSSPFSELFYLKHYSVAKGTLGYLVGGIRFILGFLFFSIFVWFCHALCPGTQFSTVSCCIVLRFCLTLECLFFSLFLPFLVLYSRLAA